MTKASVYIDDDIATWPLQLMLCRDIVIYYDHSVPNLTTLWVVFWMDSIHLVHQTWMTVFDSIQFLFSSGPNTLLNNTKLIQCQVSYQQRHDEKIHMIDHDELAYTSSKQHQREEGRVINLERSEYVYIVVFYWGTLYISMQLRALQIFNLAFMRNWSPSSSQQHTHHAQCPVHANHCYIQFKE